MSTNHHYPEGSVKEYFEAMFDGITSTIKGMWITFRYVWGVKSVSIEYPEVREVLPERSRMRLFNDAQNCISCTQCAMACPVDCIYIASEKYPEGHEIKKTSDGQPIRLKLTQFIIDEALCCYCGLDFLFRAHRFDDALVALLVEEDF